MLIPKNNLNSAEKLLLHALNNVDDNYLHMSYARVARGFQRPERAFNAELYHQLRLIQENRPDNFDFRIHQELFKNPGYFHLELNKHPHKLTLIPCIGDYKVRRISPDIVFHNAHDNLLNQLLVAEIKMKGSNSNLISKDLKKLLFYKLSYLSFKNSVFIYTGNKSDLEEKLDLGLTMQMLNCLIKNEIVVALPTKQATANKKKWEIFKFHN